MARAGGVALAMVGGCGAMVCGSSTGLLAVFTVPCVLLVVVGGLLARRPRDVLGDDDVR